MRKRRDAGDIIPANFLDFRPFLGQIFRQFFSLPKKPALPHHSFFSCMIEVEDSQNPKLLFDQLINPGSGVLQNIFSKDYKNLFREPPKDLKLVFDQIMRTIGLDFYKKNLQNFSAEKMKN